MENIPQAASFDEAVKRLAAKSPVRSTLSSADWAAVPLALRERAQFSARIDNLHVMQEIQDKLMQAVDLQRHPKAGGRSAFMDRSKFIAEMRQVMTGAGLDLGYEGLTNPAALKRLGLIYDFQLTDAHEYGRWKMGQDEALLEAWPCQEFLRVESRRKPRENWRVRWKIARGQLYKGRMIARKDDPVWLHPELNRFGRWWPPFDYNSGMGVRDVSREEAVELGVIGPDDRVAPKESEFNEGLQASVRGLKPEARARLSKVFEEQIAWDGDTVRWIGAGRLIGELWDRALDDPSLKGEVLLGEVHKPVKLKLGMGYHTPMKAVHPDDLRHINDGHGVEGPRQVAVDARHVKLIDWVMDAPDRILPPDEKHVFPGEQRKKFVKHFPGIGEYHLIVRYSEKRLSPVTMWIVAEPPSPTSKTHRDNQSPAR